MTRAYKILGPVFLLLGSLHAQPVGMTGTAYPDLAVFDQAMQDLMQKWKIPGGALAVSFNGRLALSRGYGISDVEANTPAQPDSVFRIASISKTFTGIAVLKLVEEGKLSLDDRAFTVLTGYPAPADARVSAITVRQLLQMTAGWDPAVSGDFMFQSSTVVQALGVPAPATCNDTIRYALTRPLQAAPGTQFAYANINYCILGRIIEKASGQTFETYLQATVFTPLGMTKTKLGRSLLPNRQAGEVRYYDYTGAPTRASVFPPNTVGPVPYGGFHLEALDAAGGFISSAPDVLRFVDALDGRRPPAFLTAASLQAMTARPAAPVSAGAGAYTGLAWVVRPVSPTTAQWWHFGSLAGTSTYALHHVSTGASLVALFNSRPQDTDAWETEMSTALLNAALAVTRWPARDQYITGPGIFAREVLNAANYAGGGVAAGEIAVLFPANAGPAALAGLSLDANGKVATTAGGTRVLFDNVPAPLVYAIDGQISAIVPYETAGKASTQLAVEYTGVRSAPVAVPVVASVPGIFTLNSAGTGQAAMINEDGCCNSSTAPAPRGSVVVLYATGEGQTSPAGVTGNVSNYATLEQYPRPVLPVTVTVGGIAAEILYAGAAPSFVSGVLQVNFRVPANAPTGNTVPIVLQVGQAQTNPGVTMAIR